MIRIRFECDEHKCLASRSYIIGSRLSMNDVRDSLLAEGWTLRAHQRTGVTLVRCVSCETKRLSADPARKPRRVREEGHKKDPYADR